MTGLVVVTSGFPRVSETFALNELLALRQRGMLRAVFATKPGNWDRVQPQVESLKDLVRLLPDGGVEEQAAALARSLAENPVDAPVDAVHGYFAHRPAAVAAVAAARLGVPHGFSAHALDIRKVPSPELVARADDARCLITCNTETAAQLRRRGIEAPVIPHGVDTRRFAPSTEPAYEGAQKQAAGDGGDLRVLAVGRLVEKKGFDVLLEAMAAVGTGAYLRIVGTGPQEAVLRRLIDAHGLAGRVELAGARTHRELPAEYGWADVVVVPSVVDSGGDSDGLPNVVLEAMACGRPVVASDVAAVSDAVLHGKTGLLVTPGDPGELAATLHQVGSDAELRLQLGSTARRWAVERYDLRSATGRLCRELAVRYG